MKLFRYGPPGAERAGAFRADGARVDVAAFGEEIDERFLGSDGPRRLVEWLRAHGRECPLVPAGARLGAPIARAGQIIGIGRNYLDHAKEIGAELPAEPMLFSKSPGALCGPDDGLEIPLGSTKTDWEVELAVVIGRRAKRVTAERALEHVAGFALLNDYSERAYQNERGGQFVKGKSWDTFAPLGPWLVTPDELPGFQSAGMWLTVNGEPMQRSNTREMHVGVRELIAYISGFLTLHPGDVIATGTPAGVGVFRDPPVFLEPGDRVRCAIDSIGSVENPVVDWSEAG